MSSHPTPTAETPSMKEKAGEAVDRGRQSAGAVAQTATEHAQEVKDETVKQARDLVGEARQHVAEQVGGQHQNLVTNLRSLSSELGSMAERSEQPGTATELVRQARTHVDGAADWLDGREPGELLDELRSFARRRPGTFLVGALAAGVVAGRLTRGAVAAHTDDSSGSATDATPVAGTGYVPPTTTPGYEPGTGYAHPTTPTGYEPNGPTPGYAAGGGYGATSTYGEPGPAPYPAAGYPDDGVQR